MKSIFFIACMSISCLLFAQQKNTTTIPGQTSFYAELGGPGILFSANIDRRFTKSAFGFGGRIGLGFVTGYDIVTTTSPTTQPYPYYNERQRSVVTVPIQLNYILGKPNSVSALEIGAGVTFAGKKLNIFDDYYSNNKGSSVFGTASFMYRRMPKDGGFSWRLGFSPVFTGGYIQPSGAVSVGYNF